MQPSTARALRRVLFCALALGLSSGCEDLPTSPHALQLTADGRKWVAVSPPEQLPELSAWLASPPPDAEADASALDRVRLLERQALTARERGELETARDLRRTAAREALRSLQSAPQPQVFLDGLGAIDQWMERVRQGVRLEEAPALALALDSVSQTRAAAAAALAAGDSLEAARFVLVAAERIREWSPGQTALRVLERVEQRLLVLGEEGEAHQRARHLVQSARQELIEGDPRRALLRALYALQLAGGQQMREPTPGPAPPGR